MQRLHDALPVEQVVTWYNSWSSLMSETWDQESTKMAPKNFTVISPLVLNFNPWFKPGRPLGIFGVGICRPGQIGTPVLKNISPKIDTPFQKWTNFLYSVVESL